MNIYNLIIVSQIGKNVFYLSIHEIKKNTSYRLSISDVLPTCIVIGKNIQSKGSFYQVCLSP